MTKNLKNNLCMYTSEEVDNMSNPVWFKEII